MQPPPRPDNENRRLQTLGGLQDLLTEADTRMYRHKRGEPSSC